MVKYRYGEEEIEAPEEMSADEVREAWVRVHPGLANATAVQLEAGVMEFMTRAGTKG